MNKRIWMKADGYSFVVLFIVTLAVVMFILVKNVSASSGYRSIIVEEGDSLWSIAREYHDQNAQLSGDAFIKWVERENGIQSYELKPDMELVIPVRK